MGDLIDAILSRTLAWVPGAAGLVLVWASYHEWSYHRHHHFAPGPSGVLAVGFLAGAVVAFTVMFLAKELGEHTGDVFAHERRRQADEIRRRMADGPPLYDDGEG